LWYSGFAHNPLTQKENQAMAHRNTIFRQLLQLVDRHVFNRVERERFKSERQFRSLNRWQQFTAMMFAQLAGLSSLRDIAQQFEGQAQRLYHLGLRAVKRSTLADANAERPAEFFEAIFQEQYARCAALAPRKRFHFQNKLYSFDSSVVDLCLSIFPWAKFRRTKGGIKLHTLLDHDGYIPAFVHLTTASVADVNAARLLKLPAGSIIVMDRGYVDFALFAQLHAKGILFVTRMKRGMRYRVVDRRESDRAQGVTSDQTIEFTGTKAKKCPIRLRRVGYRDVETGKHYFFLTNEFELSAKAIADIYKERWQVELFFKWIKQNLKIKSFLGTSKNAVMSQIWIALITVLMIAYYKFMAKLSLSFSQILKLVRLNLFLRKNLKDLFQPGIDTESAQFGTQLSFNFR
jgi:transposase